MKPDDFDQKFIIDTYKRLGSINAAAKELNIYTHQLTRYFIKHNIPYNKNAKYRRYGNINEKYFSDTENANALYWAGFIAADGCIHKAKISIGLSIKDTDHVQKFKDSLQIKNPIKISDYKINNRPFKAAIINVYSKKMVNDLEKYNIGPRKSLTYTFPQNIANHKYVNAFMRGYMDGDGCFCITKNNKLHIGLCGTKHFLEIFNNILVQRAQLPEMYNDLSIHTCRNIYQMDYSSQDVCKQIINWLYMDLKDNDKAPYLKRKYEIIRPYLNFTLIDIPEPNFKMGKTHRKPPNKNEMIRLYKKLDSISAVAKEMGYYIGTISKYFNKYNIPYEKINTKNSAKSHIKFTESKEWWVKLYDDKKSMRAIARQLNCAKSTVRRYLKFYNIIS